MALSLMASSWSPDDTQGGLVTSGGGNEEKRFGAFRYGGVLGTHAYGRVYRMRQFPMMAIKPPL